ncbi:hypothetical protein GLYMA_12G045450v4 [Glycine max]|nr:hypothetical protein GLYMA_12G045450v4 [Glycine max]
MKILQILLFFFSFLPPPPINSNQFPFIKNFQSSRTFLSMSQNNMACFIYL